MGYPTRKTTDALTIALVAAHNLGVRARIGSLTTYPHADATSTFSGNYQAPVITAMQVTGTAVDLPSTITVAEQVRTILLAHFADAGTAQNLWGGAHKAADATNVAGISYTTIPKISSSTGTLAQVETLLNALKTACNAHVGQSGVHFTNDGTNSVSASNATDLPSSETLASGSGGLKAFVNAHVTFTDGSATVIPVSA
jgi:hypothetical protein